MERVEKCIAVDIGGTKLLIGEAWSDGSVKQIKRYPTGDLDQMDIVRLVMEAVDDYDENVGWSEGKRPVNMGIGMLGCVNPYEKIWHQIHGRTDYSIPIGAMMKERYGVECRIENDIKSATMAEGVYGAAKGCRDYICINVGTGLSAGFVSNGKIVRGTTNSAGEVGYFDLSGGMGRYPELACYSFSEGMASGSGINRRRNALYEAYKTTKLPGPGERLTGERLFDMAQQGDELAVRIRDEMLEVICLMVYNFTWIFNPQKIVFSGGLMVNGWILQKVQEYLAGRRHGKLPDGVCLSELNPAYSGLIGAAAVGFRYQDKF